MNFYFTHTIYLKIFLHQLFFQQQSKTLKFFNYSIDWFEEMNFCNKLITNFISSIFSFIFNYYYNMTLNFNLKTNIFNCNRSFYVLIRLPEKKKFDNVASAFNPEKKKKYYYNMFAVYINVPSKKHILSGIFECDFLNGNCHCNMCFSWGRRLSSIGSFLMKLNKNSFLTTYLIVFKM